MKQLLDIDIGMKYIHTKYQLQYQISTSNLIYLIETKKTNVGWIVFYYYSPQICPFCFSQMKLRFGMNVFHAYTYL